MASSDHRDLARTRLGAITRSSAMPAEPPWTDDTPTNDHPWADPDDGDEPVHSVPAGNASSIGWLLRDGTRDDEGPLLSPRSECSPPQ